MMHPDLVSQLAALHREALLAEADGYRMTARRTPGWTQLWRRRRSSTKTSVPTIVSSSVAMESMTGRSPM